MILRHGRCLHPSNTREPLAGYRDRIPFYRNQEHHTGLLGLQVRRRLMRGIVAPLLVRAEWLMKHPFFA